MTEAGDTSNFLLRYMRLSDIPAIMTLEKLCFPTSGWSTDNYRYEISRSQISYMVVLERLDGSFTPVEPSSPRWLRRLRQQIRGTEPLDNGGDGRSHTDITVTSEEGRASRQAAEESGAIDTTPPIVGYGGLWCIRDEAHISTIATHPRWRGHEFGKLLLLAMSLRAIRVGGEYMVLEVRQNNHVAQRLYRNYGFDVSRELKNYYPDEDGHEMRASLVDEQLKARYRMTFDDLSQRVGLIDHYTRTAHPRLGGL